MYAGGLGLELLLKMGWADECTVWADLDFQCLFVEHGINSKMDFKSWITAMSFFFLIKLFVFGKTVLLSKLTSKSN